VKTFVDIDVVVIDEDTPVPGLEIGVFISAENIVVLIQGIEPLVK
jgi:hypothetical protein